MNKIPFNPAQTNFPSIAKMRLRKLIGFVLCSLLAVNPLLAGLRIEKSNGVAVSGTDGIIYVGTSGVTVTGTDGYLSYISNGITITDINGVPFTGVNGVTVTGADGVTRSTTSGVTVTGADGVTVTGADGVTVSGTDGVTVTGSDGTEYTADRLQMQNPNGVTVTGTDALSIAGTQGLQYPGPNGVSVTGTDGVTVTGTDGVTVTGADGIQGFGPDGLVFELVFPTGVTVTGADGVTVTGADGVTVTGADEISVYGVESPLDTNGLQSVDPELAIRLNQITDDSNVNAVIVYHQYPGVNDIRRLQKIGVIGGTKYERIPAIVITATKSQILEISSSPNVRSIYGNRTINFNSDPYFEESLVQRVAVDNDLTAHNSGLPVSGRNVTVAVLDTGVNSQHNDLAGKVIQNVKLLDLQSVPGTFSPPSPIENVPNTDLVSGHGTFVAGIVAANGVSSGGIYNGVAPGAKILGLGAGDYNLTHVLAGFDYALKHRTKYNIRVINCSFSADTIYDIHDPVNIATRMLTDNGVSVVFSAGNTGDGAGTLNPYALAPWTVSVGSTNRSGSISKFSSRGVFGKTGPTIVAPGESIVSLRSLPSMTGVLGVPGADPNRLTPGQVPFYTTASGTSFSAPQVAGAIALMLEADPNLTPSQIKDILARSATPSRKRFSNEAGAGMLNTHAAVLESAFLNRRFGYFRAVMDKNPLVFETTTNQIFGTILSPGQQLTTQFNVPEDTLRASSHISWSIGANDLGLKILNSSNQVAGESNFLNIASLTGRIEKVTLERPGRGQHTAVAEHTLGLGTNQKVDGATEITRAQFGKIADISVLSQNEIKAAKDALIYHSMLARSGAFLPYSKITRYELAEALVRAGYAQQYLAGLSIYPDVVSLTQRNAVESVQTHRRGAFFYDVSPGNAFYPNQKVSRLVTAVALVRAAGLEDQTSNVILPSNVADRFSIPYQYRGHVAVALLYGFFEREGKLFKPNADVTRLDLALALSKMN